MFKINNKMRSNFAPATVMHILGVADDEKQSLQRDTFYAPGFCIVLSAFAALENSVRSYGLQFENAYVDNTHEQE